MEENTEQGDGSKLNLRLRIAELELKLIEEKQRRNSLQSELAKLAATEKVDNCRREYCMKLKEKAPKKERFYEEPNDEKIIPSKTKSSFIILVDSDSDDDDEDLIMLSQLTKKRVAGDADEGVPDQEETKQALFTPENNSQKRSNNSGGQKKMFRPSDSGRSPKPTNRDSTGRNGVCVKGIQCTEGAYIGRIASLEQLSSALRKAEILQRNLNSRKNSFLKPMVPTNVSGTFCVKLPRPFCKKNLIGDEPKMILEDEKGLAYEAKYFGNENALSCGWRVFAKAHNLEVGDVLVFELIEPRRFKIYIIKAIQEELFQDTEDKIAGELTKGVSKCASSNKAENQGNDLAAFKRNLPMLNMWIKLKQQQA